jgi:hypothetical protein
MTAKYGPLANRRLLCENNATQLLESKFQKRVRVQVNGTKVFLSGRGNQTALLLSVTDVKEVTMPRYYYHVQMDDLRLPDVTGREESDLSAAHTYAVTLAKKLLQHYEVDEGAESIAPWIVHVANCSGRRELAVIVHHCERRTSAATLRRRASMIDSETAVRPAHVDNRLPIPRALGPQ